MNIVIVLSIALAAALIVIAVLAYHYRKEKREREFSNEQYQNLMAAIVARQREIRNAVGRERLRLKFKDETLFLEVDEFYRNEVLERLMASNQPADWNTVGAVPWSSSTELTLAPR